MEPYKKTVPAGNCQTSMRKNQLTANNGLWKKVNYLHKISGFADKITTFYCSI